MPWVEFTRRFDYQPPCRKCWQTFEPGPRLVTTPQSYAAVAAGAARRIEGPKYRKEKYA
jgi:hypothetical protein